MYLKTTARQIINNLFIYIPMLALLAFTANKFMFNSFMDAVSSVIPTALSIFVATSLTITVFRVNINEKDKSKDFYNKAILAFMLGVASNIVFTGIMYLIPFNGASFIKSVPTVLISFLAAGIGAAFFTVYSYSSIYKKEYRNIIFSTSTIILALTLSFTGLPTNTIFILSLLLSSTLCLGLFTYGHLKNPVFDIKTIKNSLKIPQISSFDSKIVTFLPLFLLPYIILLVAGYINAGLFALLIALYSLYLIIWSAIKNNMLETANGAFKIDSAKTRKGVIILLSSNFILLTSTLIISNQILSVFNIPIEYLQSFIMLTVCVLPFMVSVVILSMFKDLTLFKIFNTESLLTAILSVGMLILAIFPQIKLGTDLFLLYTLFIVIVLYKAYATKK